MPEITRFGPEKASNNAGGDGVTWLDIDIADDADRQWLMTWRIPASRRERRCWSRCALSL